MPGGTGASTLDEQILALLRDRPCKAAEIATALGCPKTEVNALLYGRLESRVEQDKGYRWQVKAGMAQPAGPAVRGKFAHLFAYYLDALARDAGVVVSVFAASHSARDYAQLDRWPTPDGSWRDLPDVRRLAGAQRAAAKAKTLWFGWPVLLRRAASRKTGWEGAFVEPLLLWPIDGEGDGSAGLRLAAEPMFNGKALEQLVGDSAAMAEATELAEALGLDEAEDIDPEDLAARLSALRPEWPWRGTPDPEAIGAAPALATDGLAAGLHNAGIVVIAERSIFTAGLERELAELQSLPDGDFSGTSLGTLLGHDPARIAPFNQPILEVLPLNAEQREAVLAAMREPVTVITGPPGTGKSQVVTAILANAAFRGQRVLFASKNNQAVDVVEERVNGLTTRPLLLRLGNRSVQASLAERLGRLLSQRPDPAVAERTRVAEQRVAESTAQLSAIGERLERLRQVANQAAERDSVTAPLRERLSPERWLALAEFDEARANQSVAALTGATEAAERARQPWWTRLAWPLVRAGKEAALGTASDEAVALAKTLGITTAGADRLTRTLPSAIEEAIAARSAFDIHKELITLGDPARLAQQRVRAQAELAAASLATFEGWLANLPGRMTPAERRGLGDYVALLRTIAATNESGGSVAKKVWADYYRLAASAATALPGWAVTSLSARGRVPFKAGLFDLVVIDEASQCDIASVLPLLFRAKRAVVIGDPMQLRHIARLSRQQDQALLVRHDVLGSPGAGWAYGEASLYGLAASRVPPEAVVALRDHHRSHADIVDFSNGEFYDGALRVATDYRRLIRPDGPAVRWIDIPGRVTRPADGSAVNEAEARAVVCELRRLTLEQNYRGTLGVVTPFRAQGRRIQELVSQDTVLHTVLAARDFRAGTVDTYQGDERDLMIFSPVLAPGMTDGSKRFLDRDAHRFNVALTRARAALVIVGDAAACRAGDVPLLARYARHVAELGDRPSIAAPVAPCSFDYPHVPNPDQVSDWERLLYTALAAEGVFAIPQYPVDQYRLDLALVTEDERRLDIEVDGEAYHRDPWTGENVRRDQLRDMRLMEMGWEVRRLWVHQIRDALPACVAEIREWIALSGSS